MRWPRFSVRSQQQLPLPAVRRVADGLDWVRRSELVLTGALAGFLGRASCAAGLNHRAEAVVSVCFGLRGRG